MSIFFIKNTKISNYIRIFVYIITRLTFEIGLEQVSGNKAVIRFGLDLLFIISAS